MEAVPKILMVLVLVMIVIFAVYGAVSNVVGNQGSSLVGQGQNVEDGLNCVFSNKESADEKCLEGNSGGGSGSGG